MLFGSLSKKEREKARKTYSEQLKNTGISGIIRAGLGAGFFFLAERHLLPGARTGLILPKGVLSGVSWEPVRQKLLKDYHIEFIVSSFQAPGDWNFSENTNLSEVLIVVEKKQEGDLSHHWTMFLSLWRKPRSEMESLMLASVHSVQDNSAYDLESDSGINAPINIGRSTVGQITTAKLSEPDWGYFTFFAQGDLNRALTLIRRGLLWAPRHGILYPAIPLAPLKNLLRTAKSIGPDRRQIHDNFSSDNGIGSYEAFWGHDTELVTKLALQPNSKLSPKPGKVAKARDLWTNGNGSLCIIEGARLNTMHLVAIVTHRPVISNVWWTVSCSAENYEQFLTLWLNTIPGMLLLFSIAEVTAGPWVHFKKKPLIDLLVFNFANLSQEQQSQLEAVYEKWKARNFNALPARFNNTDYEFDLDVLTILFPKIQRQVLQDIISELCELLGRDPIIANQPLVS